MTKPRVRNAVVGWAGDLGAATTVLLLRHGQTEHTVGRRFSGGGEVDGGPGLTEVGRRQAALAGQHLRSVRLSHDALVPWDIDVDVIIASPMLRTRQTAQIVADALELPFTTDPLVRECDFGAWDGMTYEEVTEHHADDLAAWFSSTDVAPPGGESFEQVQSRIEQARADVVAAHPGRTVLVVTHVTPIKSFVRQVLDAPTHALYRMEVSPASLTTVQFFADGVATLRSFNDTWHLRDL